MSDILIENRNRILKDWENQIFYLDNPKFYYLDNMKSVLSYLVKTNDKDNIAVRKYLELLLMQACYESCFYSMNDDIKDYILLTKPAACKYTDDEIIVEFAETLFNSIEDYLSALIIPCPYPSNYCEEVIDSLFKQVKNVLISRPQEHGSSYLGRELLNSWIELGVWYNSEAQAVIHVDTYSDYIEDKLKADIRDIINDSYESCSDLLKKALFAYIFEKENYDIDVISYQYDVMYPGTNIINCDPNKIDLEEDRYKILNLIIDEIRDMVVKESACSYSLDDPDSLCLPYLL